MKVDVGWYVHRVGCQPNNHDLEWDVAYRLVMQRRTDYAKNMENFDISSKNFGLGIFQENCFIIFEKLDVFTTRKYKNFTSVARDLDSRLT